jgi:hypothetical protein
MKPGGFHLLQGQFDQSLGAWARNQSAGRHLELPTMKRPGTHEILNGFMA